MKIETKPFDPAEVLRDPQSVVYFLADAFSSGESAYIADALGIVARSKGMTEIARKTGLSREALYRSLTENGNPSLKSLMGVLDALGLRLSVQVKEKRADEDDQRLKA